MKTFFEKILLKLQATWNFSLKLLILISIYGSSIGLEWMANSYLMPSTLKRSELVTAKTKIKMFKLHCNKCLFT